MRTNIVIDDELMKDAMHLSGLATKRETVQRALQFDFTLVFRKASRLG